VMVTAENGESSQSDPGVGFSVLDSAAVNQIKSDISALQRQDLSEEAQVLAIAHLERSNELYASAIDRLEVWLAQGNKSAAVSQLAGDLNQQVGLPGLARDHYVVGLEMMRRDGNLAGQAEVLNSLGQVDRDSDLLKAAIGWLEEAQKLYRELGDGERVQQLEKELTDLRKRV
jgi:tetratricopeptide (TPR) repeat protein